MRPSMLCAAFFLSMPLQALAAPYPPEGITPQELADVMQAGGYRAALTTASNGAPVINSGASGVNFSITFHGCNAANRCTSLEFHAGWNYANGTLERVNQWNGEKRYLQAHWAPGKVYVDWDVITKASSSEYLNAVIANWADIIGEFKKYMNI